jgi:hypothetical protein
MSWAEGVGGAPGLLEVLPHEKPRENSECRARALLLPAAAESLIELNEGLDFVELRLGERQAVIKIVCLVGEDFQVVGHSGLEARVGQTSRIFGRGGRTLNDATRRAMRGRYRRRARAY